MASKLNSEKILENMVQFIKQHGREEVARIKKASDDAYTSRRNEYRAEAIKKIEDENEETFKRQEVMLKITKSKEQNERRIEKMKAVNVYIDKLRQETRDKVKEQFAEDVDGYKELLKNLMLQGLIKLFEANVLIRCREEDRDLIEEIKDEVIEQYRNMIIEQVKMFADKSPEDIPCNIMVDENNYLESINSNPQTGSLGGFNMLAKKGKIVLTQTVDSRIDLCFQAAIPAIRYMLFPSMRREKQQ